MKTNLILFIFLTWILTIHAQAQSSGSSDTSEPLKVARISGGITFDGVPDEAAWQPVQTLPMIMLMPDPGNEPTEISVIKIAYDDEYFYVSGLINYHDPKYLRAIGKQRDYSDLSSDFFGFTLDTFNDRENGVQFVTNPNGLRSDATIKNDIVDENTDRNRSWNTFWDVKTGISEKGWSAEFRIPFSSLRFQTSEGKTLMGILFVRWSPAKPELVTFPAVSPVYSTPYFKPSLSKVIEFEGLKPKKPVYITPYIIGGVGQVNELNEAGTEYKMNSTPKLDAGGDIKYSITNNLTLDLTVNTDFAQVEADNQMINLTRYSLYFPERTMSFTNHIFGVKGLMTLTTKTSLASFIQYNTAINRVIANIRFRYNPREGNDFWIVYDETQNTDLTRVTPTLPHTYGRTILLKYTYTFRL